MQLLKWTSHPVDFKQRALTQHAGSVVCPSVGGLLRRRPRWAPALVIGCGPTPTAGLPWGWPPPCATFSIVREATCPLLSTRGREERRQAAS